MAKNWISSPLGINLLLKVHEKQAEKCCNIFENINKILKSKKEFVIKNKLFLHALAGKDLFSKKNNKSNIEMDTFTNCQEAITALRNWVNQYSDFKQFTPEKYISPHTKALLSNICMYKGTWNSSTVKVYNSFSYTEDIKYEVRILVVSTRDEDVNFAIAVPNETDVFCHLVNKLHKESLSSALTTIQPAFVATCKQTLPTFQFNSNIILLDLEDAKLIPSQYGRVFVDQHGIDIKVLTCLHIDNGTNIIDIDTPKVSNDCFSFAIVCKDVPIFIGQVLP